jgi:ABC-type multidrug transport system ATPase subunit
VHVELSDLTKRYGSTPALDQLTLQIPPGLIVAVIGLNGAGKTTLLRCLGGIVAPSRGRVLYDGQPFHRDRLDFRRRFLFLPDFPTVYGDMNVLQYASLMFRLYERDAASSEEAILRALTDLDLLPLAEAPLGQFSRGQLYKAALVALFTLAPELWLLDEPFASGLDPQGLAVLKQTARAHAASGGTVLYSTQILEIAEKFADLLVVIDHGRLVATYSREQLAALPATGPDSLESRLRQFREVPTT